MNDGQVNRGQWSSRLLFVLAATGSAVGLGNIWKFPYIAGENGGGAFVLIYLVCITLVGIPVMMAELSLGRRGNKNPVAAMKKLAAESERSSMWQLVGWLGVLAGFIVLCFYSVVAGWALAYVPRVASGMFDGATAELATSTLSALWASPESLLAWHTIFMVMTCIVLARGVNAGLERAIQILMPGLFVLMFILLGYSYNTGYFNEGLKFLFQPNFDALLNGGNFGGAVLTALGHAFFTLSLGMGSMMVYGSYLGKDVSITKATFIIAGLDTLIALMAGMVIFPIVFANGLSPEAGPGLLFKTIPLAFGHMEYGSFFGLLFFILVVFAAWSSSISLIEPVIAWLIENTRLTRVYATTLIGVIVWLLGIACLLSFNLWSGPEYHIFGQTFFDLADKLSSNIMLPLGGLLIAAFAAWGMSKAAIKEELNLSDGAFELWRVSTKYLTIYLVLLVFINSIWSLQADGGIKTFEDWMISSVGIIATLLLVRFFYTKRA